MSNGNGFSGDRELLVRMDERLQSIQAQLSDINMSIRSHGDKIRTLELSDSERKGEARSWGALSGGLVGAVVSALVTALMKLLFQ